MTRQNPFIVLKEEMDNLVVGHEEVKLSLLLGIIAREHVYIEGPPGTAKTMLAIRCCQPQVFLLSAP
jgi:MoxR-like ATPase